MTRDETADLLRRYHDALNSHDVAALMSFYDEDAVVVSPMFKTLRGRAALRESYENLFRLAPDYHATPDEALLIAEGDRAADFSTTTATHSDALFGLAPTGHRIGYQMVRLLTFRGGVIVHEQRVYDMAAVLERLEKARMDDEMKVAADIQRTLLPRPHQGGTYFEAIGASLPSRTIGGDFFDYVDVPTGGFGLTLGDVSGKGPAAALVAAMLQGMFSMEGEMGHAPGVTLTRINRALLRRGIEPRFATLVFGVLTADGTFTYANAGHVPPLVVRRDGSVQRLTIGGPLLGVFETAVFPSGTCVLQSGDTIVAFSDGVTEARREGGGADVSDFGEERLIAVARAGRALEPARLLAALFGAVREFSGGTIPTDDITIIIVRLR